MAAWRSEVFRRLDHHLGLDQALQADPDEVELCAEFLASEVSHVASEGSRLHTMAAFNEAMHIIGLAGRAALRLQLRQYLAEDGTIIDARTYEGLLESPLHAMPLALPGFEPSDPPPPPPVAVLAPPPVPRYERPAGDAIVGRACVRLLCVAVGGRETYSTCEKHGRGTKTGEACNGLAGRSD